MHVVGASKADENITDSPFIEAMIHMTLAKTKPVELIEFDKMMHLANGILQTHMLVIYSTSLSTSRFCANNECCSVLSRFTVKSEGYCYVSVTVTASELWLYIAISYRILTKTARCELKSCHYL